MDGVFAYFVAIGAGLSLGVAIIVLPGLVIAKKILNKGGGKRGY